MELCQAQLLELPLGGSVVKESKKNGSQKKLFWRGNESETSPGFKGCNWMSLCCPLLPPQPHWGSFFFQGCPVVEKPGEPEVSAGAVPGRLRGWAAHGTLLTSPRPQVLIYEAAGFQGRSFTISRDLYDLKGLSEPALATVGSLHVLGGWYVAWGGLEKAEKVMGSPGSCPGLWDDCWQPGERMALEWHR